MSICSEAEVSNSSVVAAHDSHHAIASTTLAKEEALRGLFRDLESVIVAYSGGVDSSYVAYIASAELGTSALCVTGQSASLPEYMRGEIESVIAQFHFAHEVIQTDELSDPNYQKNNADRCFFCKDELYNKLEALAVKRDIRVVVDGSTTDDLNDYRPGRQAAGQHAVRSPLVEVGLSKNEVRQLSRKAGLPTWDKPASPCLSSRIAYGTTVTIERLSKIDRGEEILREFGFREFRVRNHDTLVRLEISPAELDRALKRDVLDELAKRFRELGFKYVTLDLHGFRSGSMNESLPQAVSVEDKPLRTLKVI